MQPQHLESLKSVLLRGRAEPLRVLVTGARTFTALEWVRAFAGQGHAVWLADGIPVYAAACCRSARGTLVYPSPRYRPKGFRRALAGIVSAYGIDLVVPSCEEVFALAAVRDDLGAPLFADDLDLLRTLHSKHDYAALARGAGATPPEMARVTSREEALAALAHLRPAIMKAEFSRFGRAVLRQPSDDDVAAANVSPEHPWVVQDLIEGEELCSFGLALDGRQLAHATYRPAYRLGGASGYYYEPVHHPDIEAFSARVIEAANLTGQIAFDILVDGEKRIRPIECNPRATNGLHLFEGSELCRAVFGDLHEPARPRGAPAMIGPVMAMELFGAAIDGRSKRVWRDVRRAKDVMTAPGDRHVALGALLDMAGYGLSSVARGRGALDAIMDDIQWDGDVEGFGDRDTVSPVRPCGVPEPR